MDREVTEFREVSPGVYFPAKLVSKSYTPLTGVFRREGTIILKDIEINRPISQSVFESNFPADVLVYDAIKQKIWRTDDAGEIGVEAQSPEGKALEYREGKGLVNALLPGTKYPTVSEPESLSRWGFLISIVLIMTGFILLIIKSVRNKLSG